MAVHRNPHDWASEEYVDDWLKRVSRREADRAAVFDLICNLLPFEPNDDFRFIDLGTGSGYLARFVLERFLKSQAVGLDASAAMLARARETLRPYGQRVRFVQADFGDPAWTERLRGERFDAVVASKAVHNLFDAQAVQRVYRQVHEILSERGTFLTFDNINAAPLLGGRFEAANDARKAERASALGGNVQESQSHGHHHHAADDKTIAHAEPFGQLRTGSAEAPDASDLGAGPAAPPDQRPDYGGSLEDHLRWLSQGGFQAADCAWRQLFNALLIARN